MQLQSINTTIKKATTTQVYALFCKLLINLSNGKTFRMLDFIRKSVKSDKTRENVRLIQNMLKEDHPSYNLFKIIPKTLSKNCKNKLIKNLFVNAAILGPEKRSEIGKRIGFIPPFFFVISPTARCNLNCVGCYAGGYTKEDDLPIEVVDRLLKEAKELGIHFITISGGEPFIRKDMLDMFKKHNDMYFLVYTNGQLIDENLAKKLAELGNVAPAISVEGFCEETDRRRGQGVYSNVVKAMHYLKKCGVLFGFSATPTRINSDVLATDKFIDYYIEKGCKFGWFFQYIPIGKKPDVRLMATPQQRNKLRLKIGEWRKQQKPIFMGDFWNDGPYVGGCIAGARRYFHITCKGDVEPCVFMHFAVDNIKNKSLIEVMNSDFFKAIRTAQPYCANKSLLTPCAIIDNPQILRGIVKKFNARPTHPGSESIVEDKKIVDFLDKYSRELKRMTDPIWENEFQDYYERWFGKKEVDYKPKHEIDINNKLEIAVNSS